MYTSSSSATAVDEVVDAESGSHVEHRAPSMTTTSSSDSSMAVVTNSIGFQRFVLQRSSEEKRGRIHGYPKDQETFHDSMTYVTYSGYAMVIA